MIKKIFQTIDGWIAAFLIAGIKVYQKTFSPDHGWMKHAHIGPFCRYTPTCSEYGIDALKRYGAIKGLSMTLWRILRCNPWSKGGYDPAEWR